MSDLGNKEIFSKNLKYYMELNNKDRNDLCRDLGFAYTTFAEWYNAKIYPRIDKIEMIANYFGIKKSDLIENKSLKDTNLGNKIYNVPYYGSISAGIPNWAEECLEGYLPIDPELMHILNPEEYFFLKVAGESMNKVVKNGAYALIHKQDVVNDGEIAVVLVNGYEATIKEFSKKNDIVVLTPHSDDTSFKQQIYDRTTPIRVLGKYVGKLEIN